MPTNFALSSAATVVPGSRHFSTQGLNRTSHILSSKILNQTSTGRAGRAVVLALLTHSSRVIVPRFRTIGATFSLPLTFRHLAQTLAHSSIPLAYSETMEVTAAELQPGRTLRPRAEKAPKIVPSAKKQEQCDELYPNPLSDEEKHIMKVPKPRRKTTLLKKKTARARETKAASPGSDEDFSLAKTKKQSKGMKIRKAPLTDNDAESFDGQPQKKKRNRAPKAEPVYVIPEVERKETTFRGRLGR
jgi:hypothetical protein